MAIKAPSRNISASLRSQREAGPDGGVRPSVGGLKANSPSMTIPGDGRTEHPPGALHPRSAKHYADALGPKVH